MVLDNLVDAGFMTEGQVFGARRHPATPVDRRDDRAPNYYLDWAFDEMKKLVDTFPKSMTERVFVVRTALDTNLQHAAETAVENSLRQYGHEYHAEPGRRGADGYRRRGARHGRRARLRRQPVQPRHRRDAPARLLVQALRLCHRAEHGLKPSSIVVDAPICIGNWCPHNYGDGYRGAMTLITALTHSINTIAVRLSVIDRRWQRQARPRQDHQDRARHGHPHAAARHAVAADRRRRRDSARHVGAYATFPNLGMKVMPHAILEVRTGGGKLIWRYDRDGPKPRRVLPAHVAADMIKMMNSVVENGTGRRARLDGIAAAGKTGTTNAYRDAWFMGYTGNFVCGVWFGNDDYTSTNRMTGGVAAGDDLAQHHGLCASGHRD